MDAAVLIGNGLNRCYDGAISWSDLLQGIADEYGVTFCPGNPFPLEFESIVNQILQGVGTPSKEIYTEVKEKIASKVIGQYPPDGSIHERFVKNLPVEHFLTTNYDYMLERTLSIEGEQKSKNESNETKYSINRVGQIGNKRFYHIHGEAKQHKTLCLGYEHYAGYLAQMRAYLKTKSTPPSMLKDRNTFEYAKAPSWLNLFFTHDIYIVGLTLDPCEIDIWWLLTYRAYLYYSNDSGLRKIMKNKIVLFYTDQERNKDKETLFKNLHVECRPVPIEDDEYLPVYENICQMIAQSILERKNI